MVPSIIIILFIVLELLAYILTPIILPIVVIVLAIKKARKNKASTVAKTAGSADAASQDKSEASSKSTSKSHKAKPAINLANYFNGLSIALYVGSFLVLSGVGILVSSGAKTPGLVLLIFLQLLFYISGICLRHHPQLKIASHVFVGTGMIILPFIALLLHYILNATAQVFPPELIWLTFSLISIPFYLFATYIMQNEIFSYFVILALISFTCSLSASLSLAIFWYFVFLMLLGIVLSLVNFLVPIKNPKFQVLKTSFSISGEWLPLAALLAAFVVPEPLSTLTYLLLFTIIVVHSCLHLIFSPKLRTETILRFALSAWALTFVRIFTTTHTAMGLTLFLTALGQIFYSFYRLRFIIKTLPAPTTRHSKTKPHSAQQSPLQAAKASPRYIMESAWLIFSIGVLVIAGLFFDQGLSLDFIYTFTSASMSTPLVVTTLSLILSALFLVYAKRLLQEERYYSGLIAVSALLPFSLASILTYVVSPNLNPVYVQVPAFILEITLLSSLFWPLSAKNSQSFTMAALATLSIMSLYCIDSADLLVTSALISPSTIFISSLLFLDGLLLYHRSLKQRESSLQEISIYLSAFSIIYFLTELLMGANHTSFSDYDRMVLFTQLALPVFCYTSHLFDLKRQGESRVRLIVGIVALLLALGCSILFGSAASFVSILFLAESVAIICYGLFIREQPVWIIGAVATVAAIIYFTKDYTYIWPILLGFGLIAVALWLALKNGSQKPKK